MLLACVQTDVAFADLRANRDVVLNRLAVVAKRGAALAVFPECMLSGYGYESREEALDAAIELQHPVFDEFCDQATQTGICFTVGLLLRDDGKLFNASVLVTPDGIAATYRKVHLPHLGVDRFVDRGDKPYAVHATETAAGLLNIGMAICYDSSFPEPMRCLGLAGADVIALGTNWPVAAARTAELVPASRSMENHLFFVAANRIGTERGFSYCGQSSICGPDGVVLASAAGDEDTILYAEIDPQQARNKRIERTVGKHVIDRFADRRPEFYGPVAQNDTARG